MTKISNITNLISRKNERIIAAICGGLSILLTLTYCFSSKKSMNQSIQNITVEQLFPLLENKEIQLVDVRTIPEYQQGHIDGAINIDVRSDNFIEKANTLLDKKRPIILYCRSGARSNAAANILCKTQFQETIIYNLLGGYLAYSSFHSEKGKK